MRTTFLVALTVAAAIASSAFFAGEVGLGVGASLAAAVMLFGVGAAQRVRG